MTYRCDKAQCCSSKIFENFLTVRKTTALCESQSGTYCTGWTTKKWPAFRFARVLVIFFLVVVCILGSVCEQSVNSRAVTMLWYTGCNLVIMMSATEWLVLCYSSCIVCGFDSCTELFKCLQRKFRPFPWGGKYKIIKLNKLYAIF